MRRMKIPLFFFILLALPGVVGAQAHSATLTWSQPQQPAGVTVTNVSVQKDGATVTNLTPATLSYVDNVVTAGQTYIYAVTNTFNDSTTSCTAVN